MELQGASVIVVGLGSSGQAAARLCLALGARVLGTDVRSADVLEAELAGLPIEVVAGGHGEVDFSAADCIVVSPGVPPLAALDAAAAAGVEVISELELASRHLQAPLLCVGGTNGKSTVTMLLAAVLRAAGQKVFCGGNLGTPLSDAVMEAMAAGASGSASEGGGLWDALVVEASSFQLERLRQFRPKVSLLLNLSDDHLDRYARFEDYVQAKGNAFERQLPEDFAVVPSNDPRCGLQARRGRAQLITFGVGGDYDPVAGEIIEQRSDKRLSLAGAKLYGRHNALNAAAAVAAARAVGAPWPAIERGLSTFEPLPHRMAFVCEHDEVRFYDDSKATNVGAAVTALSGLDEPRGVLIAGGRDKLGSYEPLAVALRAKGRAAIVMGESADRIAEAVGGTVPVQRAQSMTEAVLLAQRAAQPGDAVLLSPACSSFDMFDSYAHRGEQFVAAVESLARAQHGTRGAS